MDSFNDFNGFGDGFPLPAAALAWQVFLNTGEPGMYMLYRDLKDEVDKRFE